MLRLRQKSLTSDKRWEGTRFINGGVAHPIRLTFWGEGNGPVTLVRQLPVGEHPAPNPIMYASYPILTKVYMTKDYINKFLNKRTDLNMK